MNHHMIAAEVLINEHLIGLSRHKRGTVQDWYIVVRTPSGLYAYDGYWPDSAAKTIGEALNEALSGAEIKP